MSDRANQKALSEFLSEAQEIIEALGKDFLRLEAAREGAEPDPDIVNAVFRGAHSLKGLAGMFGVERLAKLAHALEDLLDEIRMGRRALDGGTLDVAMEALEVFSRIIAEESEGEGARTQPVTDAALALAKKLHAPAAPAEPPKKPADVLDELELEVGVRNVLTEYEEHRLRANAQKGLSLYRLRASFDLMTFDKGLAELNARVKPVGEVISTLPSAEPTPAGGISFDVLFGSKESSVKVQAAAGNLAQVIPILRKGQAQAAVPMAAPQRPAVAAAPPPEKPPEPPAPAAGGGGPGDGGDASLRSVSQTVRVDIKKLDRLMNVVGELVLVKTNLLRLAERMKSGEQSAALAMELHRENRNLERKLNELQDGILEVRMVPLGQVFDKLARLVRKIARDAGKEIDFRVAGGDVELDKLIVEDLSDPLMHLIRNAIDHAVEAPDVRAELGKGRRGIISLTAAQKGNHVQIAVEDDGSGIDEERVREVAVQKGLVSAAAAGDLPRRDVLNFIFMPGFSTAREVTELSGRGVGMDVVKTNIANLSGIIDVQTERGQGTRFEITLPVTLAIIRALVVGAGGRTYAVPLNSVLEILAVSPDELRTIETREVLSLRGSTLPLVRLGRFFGYDAAAPAPAKNAKMHVVVVGLAQERLGVAVDELVGQQDIVIKSLGRVLGGVRGISGATDLGNRRTVLVLDVGAIIEEVLTGEAFREAV